MYLQEIYDNYGARKNAKRVGRGIGSGKGKTAGRGVKGQKARSGVAIKGFEGGQTSLIKRLPKRGFRSVNKIKYKLVDFDYINYLLDEKKIKAGDVVNKDFLVSIGFIKNLDSSVKLVSNGELKSKISFELDKYTESAIKQVEAQKGSVK